MPAETTDAMPPEVNAETLTAATAPDVLPLDEMTLIGVTLTEDSARAILRTDRGRILLVTTGDETIAGQVMDIGESFVVFRSRGQESRLDLPVAA